MEFNFLIQSKFKKIFCIIFCLEVLVLMIGELAFKLIVQLILFQCQKNCLLINTPVRYSLMITDYWSKVTGLKAKIIEINNGFKFYNRENVLSDFKVHRICLKIIAGN